MASVLIIVSVVVTGSIAAFAVATSEHTSLRCLGVLAGFLDGEEIEYSWTEDLGEGSVYELDTEEDGDGRITYLVNSYEPSTSTSTSPRSGTTRTIRTASARITWM